LGGASESGCTPLILVIRMDMTTLLLQCLAGAAGGNIAGVLNKAKSLGPLLNTILGVVGGVGGGQLLGGMTGGSTAGTVGIAAVFGALLPLIGGMLKKQSV